MQNNDVLEEKVVAKVLAPEPKEEVKKTKSNILLYVFERRMTEELDYIKGFLQDMFQDNWELTVLPQSNTLIEYTEKWLSANKCNTEKDAEKVVTLAMSQAYQSCPWVAEIRNYTRYEIVLRFPKLTVTDGYSNHDIYDTFIKIYLSSFLNGMEGGYMRGMRTTFTFAEICSDYKFSHMHGNWRTSWDYFCFGGGTSMAILTVGLYLEYNRMNFELFCAHLNGYLSWESIDGGPYKRIDSISERVQDNSSRTVIRAQDNVTRVLYRNLLETPGLLHKGLNIQFLRGENIFFYKLYPNDQLRHELTRITEALGGSYVSILKPYDSVRQTFLKSVDNSKADNIASLLATNRSARVRFKGTDYPLVIMDTDIEPEQNHPMMIAEEYVIAVTNLFNKRIAKRLADNELKSE